MELKDIGIWCLAKANQRKSDMELQAEHDKQFAYMLATLTTRCMSTLLSKHGKMPTYEQIFPNEQRNDNFVKTENDVYEHLKNKLKKKGVKHG